MIQFFELNNEGKIGYKNLTDADLRRSSTSHQTHIGLFDDVLTFLPNEIDIEDALFVYNDSCDEMSVSFNRIQRQNGEYNSPKIKAGGVGTISITTQIYDIANKEPNDIKWYLLWFGLKSEQPVFFLLKEHSEAYNYLVRLGLNLTNGVKDRITKSDPIFQSVAEYVEGIINKNGKNIIREAEEFAQTGTITVTGAAMLHQRKIRTYNIDRANKIQKEVGKKGEEYVNKYLKYEQSNGIINKYIWYNKDLESGLPYDFSIEENNGNIIYLDVKSTAGAFNQKIYYSNQEISFIANSNYEYKIFRVFNIYDTPKLKICDNYKDYAATLNQLFSSFQTNIETQSAAIQLIKVAIPADSMKYSFGNEIDLSTDIN